MLWCCNDVEEIIPDDEILMQSILVLWMKYCLPGVLILESLIMEQAPFCTLWGLLVSPIKPNVVNVGAEQYDGNDPVELEQQKSYFSYFYMVRDDISVSGSS